MTFTATAGVDGVVSRRQVLRFVAPLSATLLTACRSAAATLASPVASVTTPAPAAATTAALSVATGGAKVLLESDPVESRVTSVNTNEVGARSLMLLYTSDVQGYTDACGCQPPRGGIGRRATAIKRRRERGVPSLLLDAGNAIFSGHRQDLNAKSEGRLTVAAMNLMEYDALALGPGDLGGGADRLQARLTEAEFAVLSANVELDGAPLAEPYVLIERDGVRVGVLGLTSTRNLPDEPRFTVSDPLEAARRYVPRLRLEADVVIVMSNVGRDAEAALEAAAVGADMVINGGYAGPLASVSGAPTPGTVRSGGLGEYLGVAELRLDEHRHAVAYTHESLALDFSYEEDEAMASLKHDYAVAFADQ